MTRKIFGAWLLLSSLSFLFGQVLTPDLRLVSKPWVLHSRIIHEVLPEYPMIAAEKHVEGDIFLNVVVDEKGKGEKCQHYQVT